MNHTDSPARKRRRFRLGRWLRSGLLLYGLVCLGCASFQRKMIYHPPHLTPAQNEAYAQQAGLERWCNAQGQPIGFKRPAPLQPATGSVLVVYGNGGYAVGCSRYADAVQQAAAWDVYILEYPGYADRPGSPSEKSLFAAADEAIRNVPTNAPLYLIGESLGTGVACYLAGTYPDTIAGIILFAPFNSLTDVAQYHMPLFPVRWLLADTFPAADYLSHFHGRVGILVAGQDRVVPEKFGRRLYASYAGPKQLWEFPPDNHWSVTERSPEFWREAVTFIQTLAN